MTSTLKRVYKVQCLNRRCRVPLKDSERSHCKVCKSIIENTLRVANGRKRNEINRENICN